MKSISLVLLTYIIILSSPSYGQYHSSSKVGNYSGTAGVQLNPAKGIGQYQKFSIDLFHLDFGVNNNTKRFSLDSIISGNTQVTSLQGNAISLTAPVLEIGLPSFVARFTPRIAGGLSTRLRVFNQLHKANPMLINFATNSTQTQGINSINDPIGFNYNIHALMDVGVHSSYQLIDNARYRINVGGALRYYGGMAYGNFNNKGIVGAINEINDSLTILDIDNIDLDVSTTANQDINTYLEQFSDPNNIKDMLLSFKTPGKGMGIDIGGEIFVKDNRFFSDRYCDYKLRAGVSLTDIGYIRYNNVTRLAIKGSGVVRSDSIEAYNNDINNIKQYLSRQGLNASLDFDIANRMSLPTMMNVYADYRVNKTVFVSAMMRLNIASRSSDNPFYYGSMMVAPRIEMGYIEASLPITYVPMSKDLKVGMAMRLGPLVLGSDDLSVLFTPSRGANLFLGLRIDANMRKSNTNPINNADAIADDDISEEDNNEVVTDSDGDGVPDAIDDCPNQKGSKAKKGC